MSFRYHFSSPKGHAMFLDYTDHLQSIGKNYFTFEEIIRDLKLSTGSAKSGLYRMKNEGILITPAKGLYIIVPPEHQSFGSIPAEELVPILMKYLQADYYVCLLSAAQYYGAAHQKPQRFQIVSTQRLKHPLNFGQVEIEIIYKKSIVGLPINDVVVKTGYLKIATPELTIMDLFLYPKRCGGLNHIATVLSELIESVNPDKLIKLAKQSKQNAWLQRLGYILEKIDPMDINKAKTIIQKLETYLPSRMRAFLPLTPEITRTNFPRSKKWMIIENSIIESDL